MSEWIRLEDELPPKFEKILVRSGDWQGDEHDTEEVVYDTFMGARVEDGKWQNSDLPRPCFEIYGTPYDEVKPDGLVKCWTRLPEPPEYKDDPKNI